MEDDVVEEVAEHRGADRGHRHGHLGNIVVAADVDLLGSVVEVRPHAVGLFLEYVVECGGFEFRIGRAGCRRRCAPPLSGVTTYHALRNGGARPGDMVAIGIPSDPVSVDTQHLVGTHGAVSGWGSGHARDSQDSLGFGDLRDITPAVERSDLDARFRAVLDV